MQHFKILNIKNKNEWVVVSTEGTLGLAQIEPSPRATETQSEHTLFNSNAYWTQPTTISYPDLHHSPPGVQHDSKSALDLKSEDEKIFVLLNLLSSII